MEDVNQDVNEQDLNQEPELVPKKAFQEVSQDMHKYKNQLKETQAQLNQFKAQMETIEQNKLEEQGRWEELARKKDEQLQALAAERQQEKATFVNFHKKNAVLKEIGGFKKDEYTSFINVDAIDTDDLGNVNPDSLKAEVERIKQSFPELIKVSNQGNLPGEAPKSFNSVPGEKTYAQMTESERSAFKMSLLLSNKDK